MSDKTQKTDAQSENNEAEAVDEASVDMDSREQGEEPISEKEIEGKKRTAVNDPDLLIGPYKPIEGEPPTIKCPNCGEEMPTTIDTCVNCGHYLKKDEKRYVPMDEKKMKKIRWIIGVICVLAFVIFMIFSGKWGGGE